MRFVMMSLLLGLILAGGGQTSARAGGLYLNEFVTPSMGVAGAGSEAVAADASTIFAFHNPAGMTRLKGNSILLGVGALQGDTEFETNSNTPFNGGNGGDQAGLAPILGSYGVVSVDEKLKLGFGLFSMAGASLDADRTWAGRYSLQNIELLTFTANPSIAYRVNRWLSVGGGITLTYGTLDYTLAAPPINPPVGGAGHADVDGDDFQVGFNFGALFEIDPQTRVGIIYISETELNFSGDIRLTTGGGPIFSVNSGVELVLPQLVRIGAYHELNHQWALLGTIGWEDWSAFDRLLVSVNAGSAAIPTGWKDTYHFSGGVHFRPAPDWLLQAGITYDTSPVSSGNRTAFLPMDRQIRYAVGAQYQLNERLKIGGAFEYIDLGDAPIDAPRILTGEYDTNRVFAFGFNVSYQF